MYFALAALAVIFGCLVHFFEDFPGGVTKRWHVVLHDVIVELALCGLIIPESTVTARWNLWQLALHVPS